MKNTDLIAVGEREFKVGDLVVMVDASDYATVFVVIARPLRLYQLKGVDDLFYGRLGFQICHATPAEIEAGHRIDIRDEHEEELMNAGFDEEFVL